LPLRTNIRSGRIRSSSLDLTAEPSAIGPEARLSLREHGVDQPPSDEKLSKKSTFYCQTPRTVVYFSEKGVCGRIVVARAEEPKCERTPVQASNYRTSRSRLESLDWAGPSAGAPDQQSNDSRVAFSQHIPRNPLKTPDSAEGILGNARKFMHGKARERQRNQAKPSLSRSRARKIGGAPGSNRDALQRHAAADWPASCRYETLAQNTYPIPRTERISGGRPGSKSIFLRSRATRVSIERSK
jgi:hypothetical protein